MERNLLKELSKKLEMDLKNQKFDFETRWEPQLGFLAELRLAESEPS